MLFGRAPHYFNFAPQLLSNGLFNFVVMETMFYLPFFILGAYAFKYVWLKEIFLRRSPLALLGSLLLFIAYMLNQSCWRTAAICSSWKW